MHIVYIAAHPPASCTKHTEREGKRGSPAAQTHTKAILLQKLYLPMLGRIFAVGVKCGNVV